MIEGTEYPRLVSGYGTCPTGDTEGPGDHAAVLLTSDNEEMSQDQDAFWAFRDDLVHPNAFDPRTAKRRFQRILKARSYA